MIELRTAAKDRGKKTEKMDTKEEGNGSIYNCLWRKGTKIMEQRRNKRNEKDKN